MNKKIPMRMCTGCGEMKPKKELVRVVKTPEDAIVLDTVGKINGRGAYVCKNPDCLKSAVKTKRLERNLGIKVPDEIYETLEKGIIN